jgi:hypothetical protein
MFSDALYATEKPMMESIREERFGVLRLSRLHGDLPGVDEVLRNLRPVLFVDRSASHQKQISALTQRRRAVLHGLPLFVGPRLALFNPRSADDGANRGEHGFGRRRKGAVHDLPDAGHRRSSGWRSDRRRRSTLGGAFGRNHQRDAANEQPDADDKEPMVGSHHSRF